MIKELLHSAKRQYKRLKNYTFTKDSYERFHIGYQFTKTNKLRIVLVLHVFTKVNLDFKRNFDLFQIMNLQYPFVKDENLIDSIIDLILSRNYDSDDIETILVNMYQSFTREDYEKIKQEFYND